MCTEKNIVKRSAQIRMLSDISYDGIIYFALGIDIKEMGTASSLFLRHLSEWRPS